ncbi:helix-hairpin-helix domain-containing protein [Chloroflexota bacterium]
MTTGRFTQFWALLTLLLIAIIAFSGIVAWSKYHTSPPIEISLPEAQELPADIYIGGAVSNPGSYPLKTGDSIATIIQAAGGTTGSADLTRLHLYIPAAGEGEAVQKIDINRAEAWLLMALPEIGEVKAKAIVEYRRQNGPFHNTNELTKVEGIGTITYQQIKHLLTVDD